MREIKFRAWDKHEEIMIYSEQADYPYNWGLGFYGIEVEECDGIYWNTMKDLEFMQFTGLKDKNGKEIYEGDICRYNLDNSLHIVEFINNHWSAFCFIELATQECNHLYEFDDFEVVGNIYESPELLKGDKE